MQNNLVTGIVATIIKVKVFARVTSKFPAYKKGKRVAPEKTRKNASIKKIRDHKNITKIPNKQYHSEYTVNPKRPYHHKLQQLLIHHLPLSRL
jgi:hypothetical protein